MNNVLIACSFICPPNKAPVQSIVNLRLSGPETTNSIARGRGLGASFGLSFFTSGLISANGRDVLTFGSTTSPESLSAAAALFSFCRSYFASARLNSACSILFLFENPSDSLRYAHTLNINVVAELLHQPVFDFVLVDRHEKGETLAGLPSSYYSLLAPLLILMIQFAFRILAANHAFQARDAISLYGSKMPELPGA